MQSVAEWRDGGWPAYVCQVPPAFIPFVYSWHLFWLAKGYTLLGCTRPVVKCFEYHLGWMNEGTNKLLELISSLILIPIFFWVSLSSHLRISKQVFVLFTLNEILPPFPSHKPLYSISLPLPTKSETTQMFHLSLKEYQNLFFLYTHSTWWCIIIWDCGNYLWVYCYYCLVNRYLGHYFNSFRVVIARSP